MAIHRLIGCSVMALIVVFINNDLMMEISEVIYG